MSCFFSTICSLIIKGAQYTVDVWFSDRIAQAFHLSLLWINESRTMMIMTYFVNTPIVKVVKTPVKMEDCFLRTAIEIYLQRLLLFFFFFFLWIALFSSYLTWWHAVWNQMRNTHVFIESNFLQQVFEAYPNPKAQRSANCISSQFSLALLSKVNSICWQPSRCKYCTIL